MTFSFGQSQHERVEVDVLRYERSPVGEYYDDNWLTVQIRVCVGGFRANVGATVLTGELVAFLNQIRPLYDTLRGAAKFETLENQLLLRMEGNGNGHIELAGEVTDQPGIGNRLQFTLQFDQSQLGAALRELERVIAEFPVRAT